MIIDRKLSDVTINIPNIKVPSPNVKVSVNKMFQKQFKKTNVKIKWFSLLCDVNKKNLDRSAIVHFWMEITIFNLLTNSKLDIVKYQGTKEET